MSSTENSAFSEDARRFFDEELMPAAESIRERDGGQLDQAARPDSYYVARTNTRMRPADFELQGLDSVENLEQTLRAFWESRGIPELARLSGGLARLARAAHSMDQQSEEVSPFIYVMF